MSCELGRRPFTSEFGTQRYLCLSQKANHLDLAQENLKTIQSQVWKSDHGKLMKLDEDEARGIKEYCIQLIKELATMT